MDIWNGFDGCPENSGPVVATIGNYDGVHRGHRTILEQVKAEAARRNARSLLITFDPHPTRVLAPHAAPRLMQTRRQKLDTLEEAGLDAVWILEFTRELAGQTGEDFFSHLRSRIDLQAVRVGRNFRFGRGRKGDIDVLERIGAQQGFDVVGVEQVRTEGMTVSSTAIRAAVSEGDVEGATRMLGRPFAVSGEVVAGEGRGAGLSFPTANVDAENELWPRAGVYVTECLARTRRYPSVTNVGLRPTFGDAEKPTVECHLLEFEGELRGERVEVRFLAHLRDEQRFDGPDALADQIARDCAAAAAYFENQPIAAR
ncbi:hypothetical protein ABI59_05010 [Acidobacteria bacterium Mor1]|nr:hypothetical protein ABI59_05010 [Acidobacteria bacterium Mor1]